MSENKLYLSFKSEKFQSFLIVGGITALGFVLRLHTIGKRSLWMDELRQARYYYSDSVTQLIDRAALQNQPPLDYFIGYFLAFFFDGSEIIYRLPALIFGTLSITMTYFLAKEIFSEKIAVLAALFTAFSKVLIEYSQEARPYSIFIFFLLLSFWLFIKALSNGNLRNWLLFSISLYFMLMSRILIPVATLLTLNILFLSAGILNSIVKGQSVYFSRKNTVLTPLTSLFTFIAYLPSFYIVKWAAGSLSSHSISLSSLIFTFNHFPLSIMMDHFVELTLPLTWLYLFFILSALFFSSFEGVKASLRLYFTLFALSLPFVHMFIMKNLDITIYLRYSIYYLPFLYILTATGVILTAEFLNKIIQPSWKIKPVFIAMFALIFVSFSIMDIKNYYYYQDKPDWRSASRYLEEILKEKDVILTESFHEFGRWEPEFAGRWFYFDGVNKDYNVHNLTSYLLSSPQRKGNVVLLLYMNISNDKIMPIESDRLQVREFTRLNIITLKRPAALLMENYRIMLEEMLRFMPEDSSRVDLYLNAARMALFSGSAKEAENFFERARKLVPKHREDLFQEKLAYYGVSGK